MDKQHKLAVVASEAEKCTACSLHSTRTKSVFARGSIDAKIVLIAEAPGKNEDEQGVPLIGRAGKFLDSVVSSLGKDTNDLYLCNVLKCRPPNNRKPTSSEMKSCETFLLRQLEIVKPLAIVTMGTTATEGILGTGSTISNRRGKWESYVGIATMPTYHPAACLYNPLWKADFVADLKSVFEMIDNV